MQTLGLTSKPQPTDNIFKRLFWPSIESQYDVDLLGQQGFYVCVIVGVMSLVLLSVMGMVITAILTAVLFLLAGCGVREGSLTAAGFAFTLYLANFVGGLILGVFGNPLIQLVILMLLFANIRATLISRRWLSRPENEELAELPERSMTSILDRFSNQLPGKLWPIGKYVFFPMASLFLILSIAGVLRAKHLQHKVQSAPMQSWERRSPSTVRFC